MYVRGGGSENIQESVQGAKEKNRIKPLTLDNQGW